MSPGDGARGGVDGMGMEGGAVSASRLRGASAGGGTRSAPPGRARSVPRPRSPLRAHPRLHRGEKNPNQTQTRHIPALPAADVRELLLSSSWVLLLLFLRREERGQRLFDEVWHGSLKPIPRYSSDSFLSALPSPSQILTSDSLKELENKPQCGNRAITVTFQSKSVCKILFRGLF